MGHVIDGFIGAIRLAYELVVAPCRVLCDFVNREGSFS